MRIHSLAWTWSAARSATEPTSLMASSCTLSCLFLRIGAIRGTRSLTGGVMFSSIFLVNGGNDLIREFLATFDPSKTQLIILMLGVIFLLGFILDWVAIVLICMPIFTPLIRAAEIDPIWFGIMVCVVIQTSYLTPPVAPSIYYLRAIAPPEIKLVSMFKGVIPFIICQLVVLFIVAMYPPTALWLPELIFGN